MLNITGFTATFRNSNCLISEPLPDTIIQGHRASNLYIIETIVIAAAVATITTEMASQTFSKKQKRQRRVPAADRLPANEVKMWHLFGAKSQSEAIFEEGRKAYSSRPQAQEKEDSNESRKKRN